MKGTYQIISHRKVFCWQRIPKTGCTRRETVEIETLKISMSGDRKYHAIY